MMGLTYTKHGEYYFPDLDIAEAEKLEINRYGWLHGQYLHKHQPMVYDELLFAGRLNQYLADLGKQAEEMLRLLTKRYAAAENVTEEMKLSDPMEWVGRMNNIRQRAEEVVLSELVYC